MHGLSSLSLNSLRATVLLHGPARVADINQESRGIDFVGDRQVGAASGGFFGRI